MFLLKIWMGSQGVGSGQVLQKINLFTNAYHSIFQIYQTMQPLTIYY